MAGKILIFVLLFSTFTLHAQKTRPGKTGPSSITQTSQSNTDDLAKHLSAAETYQISGDLTNAAVENRAIVGIGLQRTGNIAIEEGNYDDAISVLSESIKYLDNAAARTNLAVTYLRRNQLDRALEEAQNAIAKDVKYSPAHYILGNIYFTREDYKSALPELEKVLILAPDFDSARALGLTYLHLKQPERAKLLFEEMQSSAGKDSGGLHILFGQAYEQTNYPLEAEREFNRALAIDPKQPRASFFLGYVILQHGGSERLAEAGKAFEEELKRSPEDFYSNFFAGVVASSENNHKKAIDLLAKAIKSDPKRSEAYLFLGQSQIELNDLVSAEKNLRLAIDLSNKGEKNNFESRRTHFLLGRLLVKTGRKAEGERELNIARELQEKSIEVARDEIRQILGNVVGDKSNKDGNIEGPKPKETALTPERTAQLKQIKPYLGNVLARAFHNLGVIAVQTGQDADALENFSSASKWEPDFPGLNRNWGIVSFREKQFDQAIIPLGRHLKTNPQDSLIRQMLGTSYYLTGDFAKSVETLEPIETALIKDAKLAYFYVISLVHMHRNQEAIAIVNKLAGISQKNPESLFYAAQAFMFLGDYERAVKELRATFLLDPHTPRINYFIGQCLIRLNQYSEAEKAFAQELEITPTDASSKYHLALTLIERKIETEKTIALLEDAIGLQSDYADAHYQLGKIYLEKGETQRAVEQLEAAVSAGTNKDYIHYQLSIAYRKASRKEEADRELKRYQELKTANRKNDSPMTSNEKFPK